MNKSLSTPLFAGYQETLSKGLALFSAIGRIKLALIFILKLTAFGILFNIFRNV